MTGRHIFVMRHGETEMNRLGIIQGDSDTRLTDKGRETILRHADYLRRFSESAFSVLSSPVARAAESAAIVARYLDAPCETVDALREIGRGILKGQDKRTMPGEKAEIYRQFRDDPWNFRPPGAGGECYQDVEERLQPVARMLPDRLRGTRCIAVVTHGSVGKILVMVLCNLDRTFLEIVRSRHEYLHHVALADEEASLEVLDGASNYRPLPLASLRRRPS